MKTFIMMVVAMMFMVGCTANERARQWGGVGNFDLPKGQKLVTITWKGANIWYMARQMRSNEVAEVYEFCEKSTFGIVEGKVIIKESK